VLCPEVPGLSLCRAGWLCWLRGLRARGRRGSCGSGRSRRSPGALAGQGAGPKQRWLLSGRSADGDQDVRAVGGVQPPEDGIELGIGQDTQPSVYPAAMSSCRKIPAPLSGG
jgi:hypothetical protein